jgi:hypothetical protein
MKCRFCNGRNVITVADLGKAPPSNAYIMQENLSAPEVYLPLVVFVCKNCWLVQTKDFANPETFFDESYAYFSSASKTWTKHAEIYSEKIIDELGLNSKSFVTEIASNDGYLLKNFIAKDIPCLGVEPTESTAQASEGIGVRVLKKFFGQNVAEDILNEYGPSDLLIGNNVYAHVPDINDFTKGLKCLLGVNGTITLEFPHILNLIEKNQWDTIYHEHFSYFSLLVLDKIFKFHGLRVYKVEKISTHGGSLRIFGCHEKSKIREDSSVAELIDYEKEQNINHVSGYTIIQDRADQNKDEVLSFLIKQKKLRKIVVGYGAAAKGNTLLNYAGVKPDLLPAVFDASPSKQGKFLPGSKIPILDPALIEKYDPDFVLIFPWNIKDEIIKQLKRTLKPTVQYVVASPELKIG